VLYYIIQKHITKKWSQDAQVPKIKKNGMLLYFYELCNFPLLIGNVDPHIYTNTSGAMDSELDVCPDVFRVSLSTFSVVLPVAASYVHAG